MNVNVQPPSRWVVTGAAGFIGSNLCQHLLDAGHQVTGIDNFFSGKRAHIERLEKAGGNAFTFVECDICDADALNAAVSGCDVFVHLAAQVSVQRSIDLPDETNAINVSGFLNAYHAALSKGAGRFIYASTCAVYGDNEHLPLGEDQPPRPLSPYAVAKLANELYAGVLVPANPAMAAVGLRFFNIFGPWQDHMGGYAAVIPRWISACLDGQRPTMFGDGGATRDFCYVGNVCRAIISLGAADELPASAVYNIGTGVSTSLNGLFETILTELRVCGVEPGFDEADRQPWRHGDIVHSVADISRAADELGYSPRDDLAAGIRALLKSQYGLNPQPDA